MAVSNMTLIATLSGAMLQAREAYDAFRKNWQTDQPQSEDMKRAAKHYCAAIARTANAFADLVTSQNRNVTVLDLEDRIFQLQTRLAAKKLGADAPAMFAKLVQSDGQRIFRIARNKIKDSDAFEDTSIGANVELIND